MNVAQLQRLRNAALSGSDRGSPLPQPGSAQGGDSLGFGTAFKEAVERVDEMQKTADDQITSFVAGEQENVHEVMIAMNQARLSFQLMTEVRNKMLETYQELMRMQI